MRIDEILKFIEGTLSELPERISGNEANRVVAERLSSLAVSNRDELVECLKRLMYFRRKDDQRTGADAVPEAGIWMALHVAEALKLQELRPDIECLVRDIRSGLIFMPVHESMVSCYLERIKTDALTKQML
jgi:hypothetical protein